MPRRISDDDKPIIERIRVNLVAFRKAAGLSLATLGAQLGIREESLRRMEQRGGARIDSALLERLAHAFGRDPGHFFMADPPYVEPPTRPRLRLHVEEGFSPPAEIVEPLMKQIATANAAIAELERRSRTEQKSPPVSGVPRTENRRRKPRKRS